MSGAALEVRDLSAGYGPVRALRHVSLTLPEGSVVAVLGSNGAGKSTLLRAISRTLSPDRVVAAGLCQVPEGCQVFARMTVADNLRAGALGSTGKRAARAAALRRVHEVFPVLADRAGQRAGLHGRTAGRTERGHRAARETVILRPDKNVTGGMKVVREAEMSEAAKSFTVGG